MIEQYRLIMLDSSEVDFPYTFHILQNLFCNIKIT